MISVTSKLNINEKNFVYVDKIVSEILQKIEIELLKDNLKIQEKLFLSSNHTVLLKFQKQYRNQIQEDFL